MKGGVLKVIRGALVAMKGTRRGNLYFLDGSMLQGELLSPTIQTDQTRLDYGTCD